MEPEALYASLSVLVRACWAQAGLGAPPPSPPLKGVKAKAWRLLIHAEASLSHKGPSESLVPPAEAEASFSRPPFPPYYVNVSASLHVGRLQLRYDKLLLSRTIKCNV